VVEYNGSSVITNNAASRNKSVHQWWYRDNERGKRTYYYWGAGFHFPLIRLPWIMDIMLEEVGDKFQQ